MDSAARLPEPAPDHFVLGPGAPQGGRAIAAWGRLALQATGGTGVMVFARLKDGSYLLEHASKGVPLDDLAHWQASLPCLEDGDDPRSAEAHGLLDALSRPDHPVGMIRLVPPVHRDTAGNGHPLGAFAILSAGPIPPEIGADLAATLAPTLSHRASAREQVELERRLRLRVYRLHTIFDLSRTLGTTFHVPRILRSLATTLVGQLMLGHAVVLQPGARTGTPESNIRVNLFPPDSGDVRRRLEQLEWNEVVEAARRGGVRRGQGVGDVLARAGIRRLYPMEVGGRVVGVMGISRKATETPFTEEDDEFARTLINHATLALANARLLTDQMEKRRIEHELELARAIQRATLPKRPVEAGAVTVAGETIPCFQVGGDYLDVIRLGDQLLVAVGDVSGKSVPAAILMASVAASIRALAKGSAPTGAGDLQRLTGQVNELLHQATAKSRFVSLILLTIDPRTGFVRYVNAGHNPGLTVGKDVRHLDRGGMPLGLFPDSTYEEGELTLAPGEAILLFTDGVAESWPLERAEPELTRLVREALPAPASDIQQRVLTALTEHLGGRSPGDDMTLACVAFNPDDPA